MTLIRFMNLCRNARPQVMTEQHNLIEGCVACRNRFDRRSVRGFYVLGAYSMANWPLGECYQGRYR